MNKKLIYEWLFPSLKDVDWEEVADCCVDSEFDLPELDWNTWFTHVVPKLIAGGCIYTVIDFHTDEGYYLGIMGPEGAPYIQESSDSLTPEQAYDALVEYLEWNWEEL